MTLRARVISGAAGLRLRALDGIVRADLDAQALVHDTARELLWELRWVPWRIDLRDEARLHQDVEQATRAWFAEAFVADGDARPRTDDASWSPVVELDVLDLPALQVVHRRTYQRSNELVEGSLVVPVADGVVQIRCAARAPVTGLRESTIALEHGNRPLPQSDYDAQQHDTRWPDHPLTRVRAALRWLRAPDGGGLEVTAPAVTPEPREVELTEVGCALTLPPGYLRVPTPSPTIATFARIAFATELPQRLFDVYRTTITDGVALATLIEAEHASWDLEGAPEITTVLDHPNTRVATAFVRFRMGPHRLHSTQYWIASADGAVFRLSVGAPPWVPRASLEADVATAARDFRRVERR